MQYNMYHKRPLDAQNAQPIPMPGGGRSDRPLKERSDQAGSKGAAGHGDRGAILAGAAVSPPGPQRIIAQMLHACGIQTDRSQYYHEHYVVFAVLQYEYGKESSLFHICVLTGVSSVHTGICVLAGCR